MTTDPEARHILLDTAWKLAAFAEGLTRRLLRRSSAAIEHYVPARARRRPTILRWPAWHRPRSARPASMAHDACSGVAGHDAAAVRSRSPLPRPHAVICFAALGNLLLATDIGGAATPRVVILAIVNAYVLYRSILCVTAALVSPSSSQPSPLVIRDETAAYLEV